jgi:hypothetical protein
MQNNQNLDQRENGFEPFRCREPTLIIKFNDYFYFGIELT